MTIRVALVDDQSLIRTGLRMIIDATADMTVVGEAEDGVEAFDLAVRTKPDVVLMDVRMPGVDGIEATRQIRELPDAPKVLILTTFDLDEYVYAGLRAGASGFMLKDSLAADLIAAVRVVVTGDAVTAPSVTRRLIEHYVKDTPEQPAPDLQRLDVLTAREREVLTLIGLGRSNAEIAQELHLSESTVKTHIGRVLSKLSLRDRVQAVILAYECGLVPGSGQGLR